jgi:two-component system sensor histidine kinase ArlS
LKLRTKFTLLTSALIISILLIVDCVVYLLFIRIATHNEIDLLRSKSEQIIEKIGPITIMNKEQNLQIMNYLPEDTLIRIFNLNREVVQELKDEDNLDLSQIHLTSMKASILMDINDQKILVVRVPIQLDNKSIGTFEIIEKMETLKANMNLLISILLFTSGGAVLLSVIGGFGLSRNILKPISESIQTMQEIESSLVFKQIPSRGHSNDELFKMTETFNRMMDRLSENFHKQQQFVSDASHELNTTLTIIEGYANMLRRWGNHDEKVQRESVEAIYEESKQMRKMTQQLLDLASSQQNEKLILESFDLLASCKQVVAVVRKLHSQQIVVHAIEQEIGINADPTKLKQLLMILIDNALKYSNKTVEVHLSKTSKSVSIHVKDYGIGISEEELQNVFERFYRVDQSRQRKTGGTGLGLSIAKSIVDEHHGTIRIKSQEGVGTEVIVILPIEQEE